MNTIEMPPTMMTPGKAHETAAALNADEDDDWTYVMRHIPGGKYANIDCHEPDGTYIGTL